MIADKYRAVIPRAVFGIGLLCIVLAVMARWQGYTINITPSLPRGLYRMVPDSIQRGNIVLVCLPPPLATLAAARQYVPPGRCANGLMPIGKIVQAVAGDTVEFSPAGTRVNGIMQPNSRPQAYDSQHRPLPHAPFGTTYLRPNMVWLDTPHPWSVGSRYSGPIATQHILSVMVPVWRE